MTCKTDLQILPICLLSDQNIAFTEERTCREKKNNPIGRTVVSDRIRLESMIIPGLLFVFFPF